MLTLSRTIGMTPRDRLLLKMVRCLGPVTVEGLVQRIAVMYPAVSQDTVVGEVCESLAAIVQRGYVDSWKVGELYHYDVVPSGRQWFEREGGK